MAQRILFPIAVVVLTILVGIFLTHDAPEEELPAEPEEVERADYFLAEFAIHHHDEQGKMRSILRGKQGEHFPVSQTIQIDQPHWQAESTDGSIWFANSPFGSFKRDTQVIILHEDVDIRRQADEQRPPLDIVTRELFINIDNHQAMTEERVVATDPWGSAEGIGMTLDYYRDRLQLHNQAKGRYETKQGE
ncbi:uncharacterized protein YrbK clustered with lipopolysaccharide transporters [Halorhodospira halochloris]|uniref:Uncharacterized protein YrbK clustered with lipopolysaccharide transporters n=1 Tax=Halorhodospira halochloris TaxID=1052 RepID=A0A0X8XAP1_HALHR|nr:LPS export ABC transporter periplasmic protein LptC [Halorhodospira halochloris]MBK1651680.1 LPS export ABC transporter periplasmic protein LptC [Halorhodospira halochloris]BAU58544.1 uncharacterized protein YrbK clustered with lipopolysaccharide transporters [Halorhodospira halochloris]